MTPLMNGLHEDHQHIRSLLTLLRNKLVTLEQGSFPNWALMVQVTVYLSEYAEDHHRKEGAVFEFLRVGYPQTQDQVERQLKEHQELEALTAALRRELDGARQNDLAHSALFMQTLGRFIDQQLDHLMREENRLFPLIECTLTPDDWLAFHAEFPQTADRAGEQRLALRYLELREALIEDLR